jgi:hypothetical protein
MFEPSYHWLLGLIVSCTTFWIKEMLNIQQRRCVHTGSFGTSDFFKQPVGYPLAVHFTAKTPSTQGGFNVGGINASGQVPSLPGNFGLIDKDTPADAYTYKSYHDNSELVLVFSDEFEADGRTFYPGDDPFWEGVDLHYWGTVRCFAILRASVLHIS